MPDQAGEPEGERPRARAREPQSVRGTRQAPLRRRQQSAAGDRVLSFHVAQRRRCAVPAGLLGAQGAAGRVAPAFRGSRSQFRVERSRRRRRPAAAPDRSHPAGWNAGDRPVAGPRRRSGGRTAGRLAAHLRTGDCCLPRRHRIERVVHRYAGRCERLTPERPPATVRAPHRQTEVTAGVPVTGLERGSWCESSAVPQR